jgi:hypothetical protein
MHDEKREAEAQICTNVTVAESLQGYGCAKMSA